MHRVIAHKADMKLFANQGKVEVQAQNDAMDIAAKQDIKVDSVDGKVDFSAAKEITLICGGSFVKISSAGIELGSSRNVSIKAAALQKMGPANSDASRNLPGLCEGAIAEAENAQQANVRIK